MPQQDELRRRLRQRDVLAKRLEDPVVLEDEELTARIRASLFETDQRIELEQMRRQQAGEGGEEGGEHRRRRR